MENGQGLWMWDCIEGNPNQQWTLADDGRLMSALDQNYCADASDMSDGISLQLWECSGYDQEIFAYDPDMGTLSLANVDALCVSQDGEANAAEPIVGACDSATQWDLVPAGQLPEMPSLAPSPLPAPAPSPMPSSAPALSPMPAPAPAPSPMPMPAPSPLPAPMPSPMPEAEMNPEDPQPNEFSV